MCGIVGIISKSELEPTILPKMIDSLRHRGPDSSGYEVFNKDGHSINLGHSRLSIIDLNTGNQPMFNEDKSICIVFNGEIYNFLDIKNSLEKKGHCFRTHSDTETILHLYQEYGEDFISRLDGMFAFAIWDHNQGKLILGRDISGQKPLYYYENGSVFIFASEIKAILNSGLYKSRVNVEKLPDYLTLGYVSSEETLYKDILKLPASTLGTKHLGHSLETIQYWDWINEKSLARYENFDFNNEDAVTEHIRYLVIAAVEKRLVSDVPLGCFLSGGVDSPIIAGIISKILNKPIKTFTIGFSDNPDFDESEAASVYARRFGTIHSNHRVELNPESTFKELLHFHDEPYGDTSSLPTYCICKETRKLVTVSLSGDGGDELFAGYPRFKNILKVSAFPHSLKKIPGFLSQCLPTTQNYYHPLLKLKRYMRYLSLEPVNCFLDWNSFMFQHELTSLLNSSFNIKENRKKIISRWSNFHETHESNDTLNKFLYLNYKTYLYDDLNIKVDKMSMANSLEIRSPFLDKDLTEFCALMPAHYKLNGNITKYILKKAFPDLLTTEDLNRRKQGFAIPVNDYFSGPLKKLFVDNMYDQSANIYKFLNYKNTKIYMDQHFSKSKLLGQQFWLLLNLKFWLDSFS